MSARIRTGARSFLHLLKKVCKLFRHPGFQLGLVAILGPVKADDLQSLFLPVCSFIETQMSFDPGFNAIDVIPEATGDEDIGEPA